MRNKELFYSLWLIWSWVCNLFLCYFSYCNALWDWSKTLCCLIWKLCNKFHYLQSKTSFKTLSVKKFTRFKKRAVISIANHTVTQLVLTWKISLSISASHSGILDEISPELMPEAVGLIIIFSLSTVIYFTVGKISCQAIKL